MTPTPQPGPGAFADSAVCWFGQSRRTIGGVPDSRYGWLTLPDGPCIVKAMDPRLVAYNSTLLDHERRMLRRLQALGAPAPKLLDAGRDDWLVTRFAGLSLQRLRHPGGLQGSNPQQRWAFAEQVAVWVHLLRRLQPMADAGVLAIDLYDANVVVPLTEGTQGQLRLHEVVLIDHAYTLEPGLAMRRPVWLNREMARIAPELRAALCQDQEALVQAFEQAGAELPGYSRLPGDRDQHSRRVWAEYDAPQALQQLLDSGRIGRDAAMQFAAATAMQPLLAGMPQPLSRERLVTVLGRMTDPEPALRYTTLSEAADALATALGTVPMVSAHRYAAVQPADLALPEAAQTPAPDARAAPTAPASPTAPDAAEAKFATGARAADGATAAAYGMNTARVADVLADAAGGTTATKSEPAHWASAADHGSSPARATLAGAGHTAAAGEGRTVQRAAGAWVYWLAALAASVGAWFPLPW